MKSFLPTLLILALSLPSLHAAPIWGTSAAGELEGTRTHNELQAFGDWEDNFSISWDVEQISTGWVYSYAIQGDKDISHFILEVTQDALIPIIGHNGEILEPELYTHSGNLLLPEPIYGVKADHGADFYSFFSDRAPVYGNFFAKSGNGTYAYNTGLTNPESDHLSDFIVRPDGEPIHMPEPASMILVGVGAGFVALRRKRRTKALYPQAPAPKQP